MRYNYCFREKEGISVSFLRQGNWKNTAMGVQQPIWKCKLPSPLKRRFGGVLRLNNRKMGQQAAAE